MNNLLIILVSLILGMLLQKVKALPKDTHVSINAIILHICLPSLIFVSLPTLIWNPALLSFCFVAWVIFGGSFLFFTFLGKRFSWSRATVGCLILTAGLGNTAFVGFPIIELAYGKEAVKYAVLLDQAGTFLICSSFGVWASSFFSETSYSHFEILKRVAVFPPFVSFVLALFIKFFGFTPEGSLLQLLERFSAMLAPLALISVGLQLKPRELKSEWKFLSIGLFFKLFLAPTIIFCLYKMIGTPQYLFKIAVLESSMAPMLTAAILASSHHLRPKLAGLMIGVGVPVSFVTVSIWYLFI